jgi:hypothetical protein
MSSVWFTAQYGKTRVGKLSNPCIQSNFMPMSGDMPGCESALLMAHADAVSEDESHAEPFEI